MIRSHCHERLAFLGWHNPYHRDMLIEDGTEKHENKQNEHDAYQQSH